MPSYQGIPEACELNGTLMSRAITGTSLLWGDLPRPLVWCESLHASLDGSIDEGPLRDILWIGLGDDEGQDSMHAAENPDQVVLVSIVYLGPGNAM